MNKQLSRLILWPLDEFLDLEEDISFYEDKMTDIGVFRPFRTLMTPEFTHIPMGELNMSTDYELLLAQKTISSIRPSIHKSNKPKFKHSDSAILPVSATYVFATFALSLHSIFFSIKKAKRKCTKKKIFRIFRCSG